MSLSIKGLQLHKSVFRVSIAEIAVWASVLEKTLFRANRDVVAGSERNDKSRTHVGISCPPPPLLFHSTVWNHYVSSVSSLPPQVDVTKCVVNTDPSFRSHWLVSAVCAFGHYLKATVLYLLRDTWTTKSLSLSHTHALHPAQKILLLRIVFTLVCTEPSSTNDHTCTEKKAFRASSASNARLSIHCQW